MLNYLYSLATDRRKGFFPSLVKIFLYILSILYGLIVSALMFVSRFKRYRADCKVVSVGNITLGGTGKTPLVEYIAEFLKGQGHKVAVVSRGYKRKAATSPPHQVTDYEIMGDEPYMLQKRLKNVAVIVNEDRKSGIKEAVRDHGADTVILDDAFQQWSIEKDLEVVMIDATCPFGNRQLLPRGILRQPLSTLSRADVFVLSKTNLVSGVQGIKDYLARIDPEAEIIESIHYPVMFYEPGKQETLLNKDVLKGKNAAIFCAIADPGSFENLIKGMGINIIGSFIFPDHHSYTEEDLDKIFKGCKDKNIDTIITTEKDAVKLYGLLVTSYELRILVLRIELKIIRDEQRFHNRLLKLYTH